LGDDGYRTVYPGRLASALPGYENAGPVPVLVHSRGDLRPLIGPDPTNESPLGRDLLDGITREEAELRIRAFLLRCAAARGGGERFSDLVEGRSLGNLRLGQQLPHPRDHLGAVVADRLHQLLVRHGAAGVLQVEAVDAERGDRPRDLLRDGLRGADVQCAVVRLRVELPDPRGAPAALAPDLVAVVDPVRGELLARSGVGRGDVPGGVDTDGAALPAELRGRL